MINDLVPVVLPREYGYVLLSGTASFAVAIWHAVRIKPFRVAAGIKYPYVLATPEQVAAEKEEDKKQAYYLFNCAQRAHYHFIENYISTLPAMLVAGLQYPIMAAVTGALWSACRVAFAIGYTRKDKQEGRGRIIGSGSWLAQLALYGMVGSFGISMLRK